MIVTTMVDPFNIGLMLHGCSCPFITRIGLLLFNSLLSYHDPMGNLAVVTIGRSRMRSGHAQGLYVREESTRWALLTTSLFLSAL